MVIAVLPVGPQLGQPSTVFGGELAQDFREIRCQFIILARKDELTSRQEARERRIAEA